MDKTGLNQWIELDATAYRNNIAFLRRHVGTVELCAVVKANAYGHGVLPILHLAQEAGVDSYAVHSIDEAAVLRKQGLDKDILLLGYTPNSRLGEALELDLGILVYDQQTLSILDETASRMGKKARVHVKVETGTHRQGLEGGALEDLLRRLAASQSCVPEGIYTHFANIEDTTRHEYALGQMDAFEAALKTARRVGVDFRKVHSACSAAALLFPRTYGTMVRLGIAQYGLWPSKQTYLSYVLKHGKEPADGLRPVMTWKCRVSQVKTVPAGRHVGYGGTYLTTRETRLAILPVGYSDGYDRGLSNLGYVLVKGRRAQVRGRVCMNLIMVDVTDIPDVRVEDEVVLLGRQGDAEIAAEDLADLIGSINYEVVARIRESIPRFVV